MEPFLRKNRLLYESVQKGELLMVDELLFRRAVNGDMDSFIKLLDPIKENLYKVSFMYLQNENDTLDCVHEAIIKAIKSLKTLKNPQYFNAWMTRITINVCKDYIKKNSKITLVDIRDFESNLIIEDDKNSFEDDNIINSLDKLSEKERELIVMRYLDDKSLKDISGEINIPLGTVKSRLNRTLKKLKMYFEG